MPWAPASFPERPRGEASLETIDDAYVTRFERGHLRVVHHPRRWMRGAVHDRDGQLVPNSQRLGGVDPKSPVAADPGTVRVAKHSGRLEGTWPYGGHWMVHFGHFLVETLTTLWPAGLEVDGLLFHRTHRGPDTSAGNASPYAPREKPWQSRFLELAGYGHLPVRVVTSGPVRVERLIVPSRSVVFKGWALPEAGQLWRRVAAAAGEPGTLRHVFLSRTRFHASQGRLPRVRTPPQWDAALDRSFAEAGFAVVHPEVMPIDDQVRLMLGAEVVAAPSGSGLHLTAFAPSRTRVIVVGDERSRGLAMPAQQLVDAACGHDLACIPYGDEAEARAAIAELMLGSLPSSSRSVEHR